MSDGPKAEITPFGNFDDCYHVDRGSIDVDDVALVHPVGFVWFNKPRYRVKAASTRWQTVSKARSTGKA